MCQKTILTIALTLHLGIISFSQSTKELFSLPGLKFAIDVTDDIGYKEELALIYNGDTVYQDTSYLTYNLSANCFPFYFYIEDGKVYLKYDVSESYRDLLYDFGVEIGDTTTLWIYGKYIVSNKNIMQLDDGYDRTVIDLHLINNSSWKLRIIEGIGIEKVGPYAFYNSNTELKCVCTDSHLLFLESTFSIEECEKRSCCDPNPYFTYDAHEKNVNLYFQANPDDSISMTFGDGVIYDHFVDSYTYQEEGCYDITITATNPCGVQWSYTNHYNYCQDPLWQNKSNLQLKDIHFVSNDVGFGVGNKMAYKTINGGEDWVVMPIPNINESSTTLSSVYFKNETEGVILTQSFSNSSYPKLLYTTTGGLTWQDIYNEKDNINNALIGSTGDIFVLNNKNIYRRKKFGDTWIKLDIPQNGWRFPDIQITNQGLLCVVQSRFVDFMQFESYLLFSDDNGDNWDELQLPFEEDVNLIYFFDRNHGFVSTAHNLYETNDGGESWNISLSLDMYSNIYNLSFYDENHGVISDINVFYTTIDGGDNWELEFCANENYITDITSNGKQHYAIVGKILYKNEVNPDFICDSMVVTQNLDINSPLIFPNPFHDYLTIDNTSGRSLTITLYNIYGIEVSSTKSPFEIIDTSKLPPGLYLASVYDGRASKSYKVIKI